MFAIGSSVVGATALCKSASADEVLFSLSAFRDAKLAVNDAEKIEILGVKEINFKRDNAPLNAYIMQLS